MNVPDLRNVDFDAYRQQALELRQQAMNEFIDRCVGWIGSMLRSSSRSATPARTAGSAACAV
jgi:hypothetical protein